MVQFLSEIINVRDDVFSLDFSDGFTLPCQELNSIVLFLATDRQTWIIVLLYCIVGLYLYFWHQGTLTLRVPWCQKLQMTA